ncbi:putative 2-carboxy-D-arabinitol-1-phosphatase [Helianthus annuus]|nr:putative 2-carboxy-D-arabinitol-1-phosphatase [Helianthus annuus]
MSKSYLLAHCYPIMLTWHKGILHILPLSCCYDQQCLIFQGENFLVVTHKSILRALICTALGLGPERFRAFDVNNGGITVFKFNVEGEAMLQSLNMTAHMYTDHTYIY